MGPVTLEDLFARCSPVPETGCWLWAKGARNGYGALAVDGRVRDVHRLAWELVHGSVPAGMFICHRCDVPLCCNPDHLFAGTPADNAHDRDRKGRGRTRDELRAAASIAGRKAAAAGRMAEIGRLGGLSVKASRGLDHYRVLGRQGAAVRAAMANARPSSDDIARNAGASR
jgi:hypothetical protein